MATHYASWQARFLSVLSVLSVLPRPKRAVHLLLAFALLYGLAATWGSAKHIAAVLGGAGLVRDSHGIGAVVLRLGSIDAGTALDSAGAGADVDVDENQLPFDDVNATARKSDAEIRQEFEAEYEDVGRQPGAGRLYGGTLADLDPDTRNPKRASVKLTEWAAAPAFSPARPFTVDPYPRYNSWSWRRANRARYVACNGPLGRPVDGIAAFAGRPRGFPAPSLGSYQALGLDQDLCFERDTRLGVYALPSSARDNIDWGDLQLRCVDRNQARFDLHGPPNDLATTAYGGAVGGPAGGKSTRGLPAEPRRGRWPLPGRTAGPGDTAHDAKPAAAHARRAADTAKEPRTAVLLRSYTGKRYTENDRYIIRALVSELSLRSGGEFQVFLLVHVKDAGVDLWDNGTYEAYLRASVPQEFLGMTLLWNDDFVQDAYPQLERPHAATVHNAQWLSVQKFMQEFREFSFVWNWEMDARITGHAYDMLTKLGAFAKQQPRRGLWARNERYYIPAYHGDYDTDFRHAVDATAGTRAVWGAPRDVPFVNPIGPRPPVPRPRDDGTYRWGVGEEADLVTLSPLFDPRGSGWVLGNQVWAYGDENHTSESLPRRGAIVTQCRLSRTLLDIMHVENLRGNHVGSEMAPGTVALLHGLKAVYAPMPVFMDRPWAAARLARWFNNGPRGGSSGGPDSAMGWGREGRFRGCTWYYRADPPQRLYNNWVGFEDGGMGGLEWEMAHGRPCLPAMFLHPVKDVLPTVPGHESESRLPYL